MRVYFSIFLFFIFLLSLIQLVLALVRAADKMQPLVGSALVHGGVLE